MSEVVKVTVRDDGKTHTVETVPPRRTEITEEGTSTTGEPITVETSESQYPDDSSAQQ